jgi:hypothetical protein
MHNQISVMQIHAQNMQKFVLEKSRYAEFVLTVSRTMGLESVRMRPATAKGRGIIF